MKKKLCICFLFLIVGNYLFAQQNTFNTDLELQQFVDRGCKYEEVNPGMFKLTYANGFNKKVFLTPPKSVKENSNNINTTIINVWEIDTTVYANKFRFWQRVNIVNDFEGTVFADDINKNGFLRQEQFHTIKHEWQQHIKRCEIGLFDKCRAPTTEHISQCHQ